MWNKTREFVICYDIISKAKGHGKGHTHRLEKSKLNFSAWHKETVEFWNSEWKTDDVNVVATNIFEIE